MTSPARPAPGFWSTVRILLRAAGKRSSGRRKRQQELLQNRAKRATTNWSGFSFFFAVLLMVALNGVAAFVVQNTVSSSQRMEAEQHGKIVVSHSFREEVDGTRSRWNLSPQDTDDTLAGQDAYDSEASNITEKYGGSASAIERKLRASVRANGTANLITKDEAAPGLTGLLTSGPITSTLGSLILFWWAVMLIFQSEGLELDLQRRRHPMWEWLFTHPVPPGAIFLSEMLSPIAANPIYWGSPLFVGLLYGFVYGPALGLLAILLVGVPITIALACLGKALETATVLRFAPRTRGAMIGLMSWLGYASMMAFFLAIFVVPKVITAIWKYIQPLAALPSPWLRLFLGGTPGGSFSFPLGIATCWTITAITVAGSVWFSVWGTQQGLTGNFAADSAPAAPRSGENRFGRDPLYRKEFLWFIRDRSAIVQTILIPLTVAGMQAFNLRGLLAHAQGAWNYLCGTAIVFGTYFLWVLGPKSLSSEGSALWISLTWPRGLESLLKAKAWLWSLISTGIVALVLLYAAFLFPREIPKIALLGVGWFFFGRSMAEKAVTLVTVTSDSGEVEKLPRGRRWAAQLGMLTFAIGVITQQWHVAIMGIVYSYITAAAMWENFRARLPYLYDRWSEKVPPPPTLMHAMIAISILVEGGAVITGILSAAMGRNNIAVAQAISYAVCAVLVSIGMASFLGNRDVTPGDVWSWPPAPGAPCSTKPTMGILPWVGIAAAGGLFLGLLAHAYLAILSHIPYTAELLRKSDQQMRAIPYLHISYAVMAVLFAPFAEEYLFRGLLYRALDREWGGWQAVIGSAAFFAVYHPALSWFPVFLLGAANALLFKKSGRLAPAVILHMVYNAVVMT